MPGVFPMMRTVALGLVFGAGLSLSAPAPKEVPKKMSTILGQWQLVRTDGEDASFMRRYSCVEIFAPEGTHITEHRVGNEVSVERSKYVVEINGKKDHIDFPTENPKEIMKGIFKIEGNTLFICFQVKKGGARPKEFKFIEDETRLFEYKRIMPQK